MEKQFVTHEIAKQLKRLGFDEECLGIYCPELDIHNVGVNWNTNNINDIKKEWCSAPLWQQVEDWFREKYRFHIEVLPISYSNNSKIAYFYQIDSDDPSTPIYDYQDKYSEVLTASEQDVPGNYLNDALYDKNIFEMDFAYVTYQEAREKAILKAIELWKNN